MDLDPALHERITRTVTSSRVVLFMKGDRHQPRCGFSAAVVEVLEDLGVDFSTVDVLADPDIREGVKAFSQWPTLPQLYVEGRFVGGSDIVRSMHASGELQGLLGVRDEPLAPPSLTVSPAAASELGKALAGAGAGDAVRLTIDARFQAGLDLDGERPSDVVVEAGGVRILLDRASARRAEGVSIDFRESRMGRGFVVDNPNRPPAPRPLSPRELKEKLDAGESLRLYDVRGADERAVARIAGAVALEPSVAREIEALPKDTVLVFHCHHGRRSQDAAEYFLARGYQNVFNLTGGIDAWSREVDPTVRRY